MYDFIEGTITEVDIMKKSDNLNKSSYFLSRMIDTTDLSIGAIDDSYIRGRHIERATGGEKFLLKIL